jgi:hypothetical protein
MEKPLVLDNAIHMLLNHVLLNLEIYTIDPVSMNSSSSLHRLVTDSIPLSRNSLLIIRHHLEMAIHHLDTWVMPSLLHQIVRARMHYQNVSARMR